MNATSKTNEKLQCTTDYDLFDVSRYNRPMHKDRVLEDSMRRVGFMPSRPIQCVKGNNGKLIIVCGHHRHYYAKRLCIPLYYVVDDTNCNLFELEQGRGAWSLRDFLSSQVATGNPDYMELMELTVKHKIPVTGTAALLRGFVHLAGISRLIKAGEFSITQRSFAHTVITLYGDYVQAAGNITHKGVLLEALGAVVLSSIHHRYPDIERLKRRIASQTMVHRKCANYPEFLAEIERLYNSGFTPGQKVPIVFLAKREAALRHSEKNLVTRTP